MGVAIASENAAAGSGPRAGSLRADAVFCGVVLVLGWCLWLHRIGVNDYNDSMSNEVIFARESLSTILFAMRWPDQSPLYFVVLHVWQVFGESPSATRALNLLGMSAIALSVYRLAYVAFDSRRVARVALVLAVASPLGLWIVREGRMYTFQILFSVWSATCLLRYLESRSPRMLGLLVLTCALNVYTHFFGFVISGLCFAVIGIDAVLEPDPGATRWRGAWLRLRAPLVGGLGLTVLVLPQLVRLHALATSAPEHASWSMPGLGWEYLSQLHWMWFRPVRIGPGALKPFADVQVVVLYALLVMGVAAATPRLRRLALVWMVLPVLGLGLLAFVLDLRSRYFVFIAPIFWVGVAYGAVGALPDAAARQRWLEPTRRVLLGYVVLVSVGLLVRGLDGRYAEWTKTMTGLDRLYRPSMSVYMRPGPSFGIPTAVVGHRGLHEELGVVHPLNARSRRRFRRELAEGRDFVFLTHRDLTNDALRERSRELRERGYLQTRLQAWHARADVFTRTPLEQFAIDYAFEQRPSDTEIESWIEARLASEPGRARAQGGLGDALVMRFEADGRAAESTFFTDQNGDSGEWRLGAEASDAVAEERRRIGGRERIVIVAPVLGGDVLAIAFPDAAGSARLELGVGLFEGDEHAQAEVRVRVGGRSVASARVGRSPAWREIDVETGGPERPILLIEGLTPGRSRLALTLD